MWDFTLNHNCIQIIYLVLKVVFWLSVAMLLSIMCFGYLGHVLADENGIE